MRKSNYVLALAAATTVSGIAGVSRAATDTWTGAVQAVSTTGTTPQTYPNPSALWNTADANWTSTSGGTKYVLGDTAIFTDNFAGITNIIVPSSGLNVPLVQFAHVGAGATNYVFNATSTSPVYTSTTPFAGAYATQSLILDSGFSGSVTLNAAASATLLHGSTTINGGTVILGAKALPTFDNSNNDPYVTLNGGTLTMNYIAGSSDNNGVLSVTDNSTLSTIYNATAVSSRTWNGQVNITSGKKLTINSASSTLAAQFGGYIVGSGGTIAVGNGTGTAASLVSLDFVYSANPNTIYDTGTGTGTLRNNLGNNITATLGALTGGSGTTLTGSGSAGSATTYAIGNFASSTFAGAVTDNATSTTAVNKVGAATTLTLTGKSTNTGVTTVTAGTLKLDFSASGAPTSNILNNTANTSALALVGGTLLVNGNAGAANSQQFNGLTLAGGAGAIQVVAGSGGSASLNVGAIARSSTGTVDFTLPSGTQTATNGITTTTANALISGGQQTTLGGYATVNGNTWAVSGTGATAGQITGLTTYSNTATTALSAAGTLDVDVAAAGSNAVATATTLNTLRFNDGTGASTIDATGGLTVATGGVLITQNVGANSVTFNNGTVTSGSADLVLIQNAPSSTLTVNSAISGAKVLTAGGSGTIVLNNAANNQTRNVLNGGTLQIASDAALGTVPATTSGNFAFNDGGTLQFAAPTTVSTTRSIALGTNGGTFDTQANAVTYGGVISGSGPLNKTGSGTLTLQGISTNTGPTNIQNGTLALGGLTTATLGITGGAVTLGSGSNSGVLQLGDNAAAVTAIVGGLGTSGTGTANAVVGGNAAVSNLSVITNFDQTFSGVLGGVGANQNNISLTKANPNNGRNYSTGGYSPSTLTLTGANTYGGQTFIGDGTISVASINSTGAAHVASSNLGAPTTVAAATILLGSNGGQIGPATLKYTGTGETTDRVIALNNNTTYSAAIDSSGSGALVLSSDLTNGYTTNTTAQTRILALQGSNAGANTFQGAVSDFTTGSVVLTTAVSKLGAGSWTLSGANTYAGATVVANGTLIAASAGAISPNTASVSVGSGATLKYASGVGPQTVKALNIAYGGAKLDLTNNALTLHYGNATGTVDPIATIVAAAASGANFGTGIISSTQASNYGVGYSDTTLTGTGDIVMKSALKGDFDINGKVDFNDFLALQANFGATSNWITGDANYDGKTDFNDFLALQANFGQSSNGAIVNVTASQIAAMTSFAQNVPEPTALALIGFGAAGLVSRRRRAC